MRQPCSRRARTALSTAAALLAVLTGCSTHPSSPAASPSSATTAPATTASSGAIATTGTAYLALGDSVPFGFISAPTENYDDPSLFVGYPTYVASRLHLAVTNAACPGEATGGFLSATDPNDNGCRLFRSQHPLHVPYDGTQIAFATSFLRSHPTTALVTIMLGANDGFRVAAQCNEQASCILAHQSSLLQTIGRNLTTAVTDLRATGYRGPIMLVNYYSVDYSDTISTLQAQAVNGVLSDVANANGLLVADAFDAMRTAAQSSGGKTCAAKLLNPQPGQPGTCDVHPSLAGHRVIAAAVATTYLQWKAAHPSG